MDNTITTGYWALIKIFNGADQKPAIKVIAECYNPQDNKTQWRLSSDVLGVTLVNDTFSVTTKMGCVYNCNKNVEDVTKMIEDSLKALEESFDITVLKMEDWMKLPKGTLDL